MWGPLRERDPDVPGSGTRAMVPEQDGEVRHVIPSKKSTAPVQTARFQEGRWSARGDVVAVEEPLEIRIESPGPEGPVEVRVAVTMRTPGDDFELAAGFLFTEGLLSHRRALLDLRYCRNVEPQEYNVVTARLREPFDPGRIQRNFYVSSSCGVCGKAAIEAVEIQGCRPLEPGGTRWSAEVVCRLPDRLREAQAVFSRTGGLHAAGLFREQGEALRVREDVGRHNAVDKVVGEALLGGRVPLTDHLLAVSGRSSFEIVQKAVMAGISGVVAVGAPSSLAVELAKRFGMTLIGFARDGGFNVYAGAERVEGAP